MCTLVLLRRPGHTWPLLLAANRDERLDRPFDPPAPWWSAHPGVVGGRDRLAGGTWMALGPDGVVAAVLNRPGSLGPAPGRRSRGVLPLLAAGAPSAAAAAEVLGALPAGDWRAFNAVVADRDAAFFVRGLGAGRPDVVPLRAGFSLVTALDPDDPASPRVRRHRPRFVAAPPPDPDRDDWTAWEALLADADADPDGNPAAALRVAPRGGFGTVAASVLGVAADGRTAWRFASGPAGAAPFRPVALPAVTATAPG